MERPNSIQKNVSAHLLQAPTTLPLFLFGLWRVPSTPFGLAVSQTRRCHHHTKDRLSTPSLGRRLEAWSEKGSRPYFVFVCFGWNEGTRV